MKKMIKLIKRNKDINPNLKAINDRIKEIMENREEILSAFIAKYGLLPEEYVQVSTPDGHWWIERKSEKDKYLP